MNSLIRTAVAAAGLVVVSAALQPAAAQQSSIAGEWRAEVPRRVENVNGVEKASDIAVFRFTLEVKGDSVFGVQEMVDGPPAAKPRKLRGTLHGGELRLVADPVEAIIRNGAGESRIEMITTFELKLEGEELSGTQQSNSVDGSVQSQARPFRLQRAKA